MDNERQGMLSEVKQELSEVKQMVKVMYETTFLDAEYERQRKEMTKRISDLETDIRLIKKLLAIQ
jgi:hypothetical protein